MNFLCYGLLLLYVLKAGKFIKTLAARGLYPDGLTSMFVIKDSSEVREWYDIAGSINKCDCRFPGI